ncbi:hypothetical protein DFH27DRAFT_261716 [Peziza echinospora]|nr:hypothetical protein DFH27DRAFT_261716 [Peziza echinospora]
MPRTLPWLQQPTGASASTSVAPKRRKTDHESSVHDSGARYAPQTNRVHTTPDAAPAARPRALKRMDTFVQPSVEYMIPSDDNYIMVEDELCDVANLFTRSLHRAEYQRLQALALASSKNASTISEIQRPLQGQTLLTNETLAKRERISKVKKERGIKDEPGLSSDEEEREIKSQWEGTNLGALMTSPGRSVQHLCPKRQTKPATRAAAGFHRGRSDLTSQSQSQSQSQVSPETQPKPLFKNLPGRASSGKGDVSRALFKGKSTAQENTLAKPQPRSTFHNHSGRGAQPSSLKNIQEQDEKETSSEDEDDDLDSVVIKHAVKPERSHTYPSQVTNNQRKTTGTEVNRGGPKPPDKMPPPKRSLSAQEPSRVSESNHKAQRPSSASLNMALFDDFLPTPTVKSSVSSGGYKGRAMARLAQKRLEEKPE